jgi:hypothetical protein
VEAECHHSSKPLASGYGATPPAMRPMVFLNTISVALALELRFRAAVHNFP